MPLLLVVKSGTTLGRITAPFLILEHKPSDESNVYLVKHRALVLFVLAAEAYLVGNDYILIIIACELNQCDYIVPLTESLIDLCNNTELYGMNA